MAEIGAMWSLPLIDEADQIENDWNLIAKTLGIRQDYFGYYTDQYFPDVIQMIDDMLIETSPISFNGYNQAIEAFEESQHNYLQLLNLAWKKYEENMEEYDQWEKQMINIICKKR